MDQSLSIERELIELHKVYRHRSTNCRHSLDDNDDTPLNKLQHGYDVLAAKATDLDRDVSPWADSYFQQYYSWPATQTVLPDLRDSRVLLAGCGRGDYVP